MNACRYYSCKNGLRKCSNPSKENELKKMPTNYCDTCRYMSGGVYPSQLPVVKLKSFEYDIVDKNGNVIM